MKYMGSKNRIATKIIPILLESKPLNFYDLFCGGLNLSDKINQQNLFSQKVNIYANDKNKYLIALWKGLQNGITPIENITKDLYSNARTEFYNNTNIYFSDFEIGWIGFAASFNGRFFDGGYSGITNDRNYIKEQINNIKKQIPLIKDFNFLNLDYKDVEIMENSVIYCDIPYKNTKQYSNKFNHLEFWEWCRAKSKQGFKIFISEYDAPNDFKCIWQKEIKSFMKPSRAELRIERLFIHCL